MKYKKISIIIPVYNEEKTIKEILKRVVRVKLPLNKEIVVVNDGSKDNSAKIIKKFIKVNKSVDIRYFEKKNGGKGSALIMGFKKATGDIITVQDADLEYNPEDYRKMIPYILREEHKIVYGTRYVSKGGHLEKNNHLTYKIHKLGNKFLSLMTSILYFSKLTDMETCYKMFTKDAYRKIKLVSNDFKIEPEITAKLLKLGYKIKEVPISYFSRDFDEGKKITWVDGIYAIYSLVYWRFKN